MPIPQQARTAREARARWIRLLFTPSLVDLAFVALLLAEFGRRLQWQALLADGDTGWHIRTGDYILRTGTVPVRDLFSFSRPDEPWFAWEWLTDVLFALLHRWQGLGSVAVFSAVVLCLSAACLLCWLLRRGAGLWIAVVVMLATVSASSMHALARPHVFSLLFVTLALWILDEDRRRHGPLLWVLVPLSALWANMHGGFVAWLAIAGLLVTTEVMKRDWPGVRRYGLLGALSAGATLLNPYGWHLHQHILVYLRSNWILEHVQEFQSPNIRSESMIVFVLLLLSGVLLASRCFSRREWFEGLLVLAWAFAALRSARHVPLYAVAAAPLIASEVAGWWSRLAGVRARSSAVRVFWELAQDLGKSRNFSLLCPLFGLLSVAVFPAGPRVDFPGEIFPVAAVAADKLLFHPGVAGGTRILTRDQWADYLIFHFYPDQRVFFDGRSDFYGTVLGDQYRALQSLGPGWRQALESNRFTAALLPVEWPLAEVLRHEPGWRVVYRDRVAVLLAQAQPALKENGGTAECTSAGE